MKVLRLVIMTHSYAFGMKQTVMTNICKEVIPKTFNGTKWQKAAHIENGMEILSMFANGEKMANY